MKRARGGLLLAALLVPLLACDRRVDPAPDLEPSWRSGEGVLVVRGLDSATLSELASLSGEPARTRAERFALYTIPGAEDGAAADPTGALPPPPSGYPPVAGRWTIAGPVLRFTPNHPLVPGQRYRAYLWDADGARRSAAAFTLSTAPPPEPSTVVAAVYPTSGTVPENLLRLYVEFSAPMSPGEAHRHLRLRRADGSEVASPFVAPEHELWDPDHRRLTLFFDPGRIKRGVGPHEQLGPVLEAGETYSLEIDRELRDARGAILAESYRRTFRVVAADRTPPRPGTWRLHPPATPGEALEVRFPEPLDRALLDRLLWVETATGEPLAGEVEVPRNDGERLWRFRPRGSWRAGTYRLKVDPHLEDLAGNSLRRLFDVETAGGLPLSSGEGSAPRGIEGLPFTVSF